MRWRGTCARRCARFARDRRCFAASWTCSFENRWTTGRGRRDKYRLKPAERWRRGRRTRETTVRVQVLIPRRSGARTRRRARCARWRARRDSRATRQTRRAQNRARVGKLELGNPCHVAVAQCAAKHEGRAHWDGLCDAVLGRGGDAPGEANALAGGRRTKARLAAGETCASVEEQMACLLELATDPVVLATSWSGWRPWL